MSRFITITKAARLLGIPENELAVLVLRPSGGPTRATKGVLEVDIELMPDFLDDLGVPYSDPRPSNPDTSDDEEDDVQEDENGEDR